ncbi:Xylose import ATP-binding protein XylG [Fundidesulfovibrio magnetotacticus]|uniref:Xylose import ATP-binding protein XylG n=1 Tax=Fundidesulfovibrio magnetotacticus TaxID=2730080 RepID=A0A6V8LU53_9BACT|nr:ABC transporter ATP-binding protein [Fundidesulfovibrio magnetotacticus]GFK93336.1 Xylose import ATP-binding protein XylG [Fundidesulfovibrio magnetotacticus]
MRPAESPDAPPAQPHPALELKGITKRFGPNVANDAVSLTAHAGEIHALLGENGAGKSTLMSILSGRYHPDAGEIVIDGKPARFASPADALARGVGMVHQRFMLVEAFTVAENIALAAGGPALLDLPGEARRIRELSGRFGLKARPEALVRDLSMGERQRVEILKLLRLGARVLIFDEPTSVLAPTEVAGLHEVLKTLRREMRTIVFITHKLEEALDLSDRISILRRGRLVSRTTPAEAGGKANLARLMVGREVIFAIDKPPVAPGDEVLKLQGFTGGPDPARPAFREVDLSLRRGEVLAVVGVAGNGQTELTEALAGLCPARAGTAALGGAPVEARHWARAPKPGLAYVPEDRHHEGSIPPLSLTHNFLLTRLGDFTRRMVLDWTVSRKATLEAMERFDIRAQAPEQASGELSGGNLQKLLLARELSRRPSVLVVNQPTQGLDVGASEDVWKSLLAAREHAGVLLVTGELTEALTLADRVAVMFEGRVLAVLDVADPDQVARICPLMAGVEFCR